MAICQSGRLQNLWKVNHVRRPSFQMKKIRLANELPSIGSKNDFKQRAENY